LRSIFDGFDGTDDTVVLPVHPRTEDRLRQFGLWKRANEQVEMIDPVGYLDFVALLSSARVVATDSGGVQKEAFFLDTPCVTLREETEWVETVTAGWNTLVGADHDDIARELTNTTVPDVKPQPYGDGNTADRIRESVEKHVERSVKTAPQG
jgi:UDP-N-acetylglucosamine 2-epimerase (non-hydrolysing)